MFPVVDPDNEDSIDGGILILMFYRRGSLGLWDHNDNANLGNNETILCFRFVNHHIRHY